MRLLAGVVVGVVMVPTVGLASDAFPDVGDANPFHDDIGAFAGAGITSGFADGGYHPGAPVSRQAMAAFLHRGLPRVGVDVPPSPITIVSGPSTRITQVDFVLDGSSGGRQGTKLSLDLGAFVSEPVAETCFVFFSMWQANTFLESWSIEVHPDAGAYTYPFTMTIVSTQAVGTAVRYVANASTNCSEAVVIRDRSMRVENFVFDGAGSSIQAPS